MSIDPRTPVDELRIIERRLRELDDRVNRLAAPSGTQALRSVDLLGQLKTYAATGGTANQSGPGITSYTGLPSIAFDVDRDMYVLIQIAAPYLANIPAGVVGQVRVGYEVVGPLAVASLEANERMRSGDFLELTRTAFAVTSGFVGRGSHVLTPQGFSQTSLGGGTAGLDFVNGQPVTVTLSVLGPA